MTDDNETADQQRRDAELQAQRDMTDATYEPASPQRKEENDKI